jgi:hypothetical protein
VASQSPMNRQRSKSSSALPTASGSSPPQNFCDISTARSFQGASARASGKAPPASVPPKATYSAAHSTSRFVVE